MLFHSLYWSIVSDNKKLWKTLKSLFWIRQILAIRQQWKMEKLSLKTFDIAEELIIFFKNAVAPYEILQ